MWLCVPVPCRRRTLWPCNSLVGVVVLSRSASRHFHFTAVTETLIIFWLSSASWSHSKLFHYNRLNVCNTNQLTVCCSLFLFSICCFQPKSPSHCHISCFSHSLHSNMPTMCLKVIVSWLLLALNSAEFYIYCLRINSFKAWPISPPAYFSPCGAENVASFPPLSPTTDGGSTSTAS